MVVGAPAAQGVDVRMLEEQQHTLEGAIDDPGVQPLLDN